MQVRYVFTMYVPEGYPVITYKGREISLLRKVTDTGIVPDVSILLGEKDVRVCVHEIFDFRHEPDPWISVGLVPTYYYPEGCYEDELVDKVRAIQNLVIFLIEKEGWTR